MSALLLLLLLLLLLPKFAFPHKVVPAHSSEPNVITQSGAAVEFEHEEDMYLVFV